MTKCIRIGPIQLFNPIQDIIDQYILKTEDFFTGDLSFVKLFIEYENNSILIPRYAPIPENYNISESLTKGPKIDITANAKPRDKIQKEAVDCIVNNRDTLVNLAPRRGKTVISIMAIGQIQRKTLILVDQIDILKQWKDRIIQFTNLEDSDIGIIQGDTFIVDKPIVIGMVQTLKNRVQKNTKEIREQLKDFGVTIVDEVHTIVGTEKLSLPLYAISSERLIGLTATTYRSDGREYLFTEWFSNNIFSDTKYDIIPKIYMVPLCSYLTQKDVKYIMTTYFDNGGNLKKKDFFNKLKWVRKIQKNKLYVLKIVSLILKKFYEGRTILVLSEYVDFLQIIASYLLKEISKDNVELFTGSEGMSKSIKKVLTPSRENNKRITLATYKICSKAIDRPDWDCLFLLTPISVSSPMLEQAIGRVCTLYKGKTNALVYDIYDISVPRLVKMADARMNFYSKLGCDVVELKGLNKNDDLKDKNYDNKRRPKENREIIF